MGWAQAFSLHFPCAETLSAAVFGGVLPLATALLAMLFLDEKLGVYDVLGMLCVLTAIYIGMSAQVRA